MRVVSFNICHGTRGRGTAMDLPAVVAACESFDADLIALQEVDAAVAGTGEASQARRLSRALGLAYVFAPAGQGATWGNALLSRGELSAVDVIGMRGSPRAGRRDRRNAVLATLTLDGRALSVGVTHLALGFEDNVVQQNLVLETLSRRPGPRLLLGDLNRRTEWVQPDAERLGFTLATDDVPSSPRTRPRYRIDHVAVHGLAIKSIAIVDPGISDHRALVVELGWSQSETPGPHR